MFMWSLLAATLWSRPSETAEIAGAEIGGEAGTLLVRGKGEQVTLPHL